VLSAINALMTVSLVLFAAVQIWRTEVERRERTRSAVGSFWVEYFRLWRVSNAWAEVDFNDPTQLELFDPEEVLPPEWGAVLPLLGSLGAFSARLGGLAYAYAADAAAAARRASHLAKSLQSVETKGYSHSHLPSRVKLLQDQLAASLAEARLKSRLAVDTIEDALAAAPRWATRSQVDPAVIKSEPGRKLVERVEKRRASLPRWRRILGRVLPSLVRSLPDRPDD